MGKSAHNHSLWQSSGEPDVLCLDADVLQRFRKDLRAQLQHAGVYLQDTPSVKKNAADNVMVVEILCFAWETPPPATVILISGAQLPTSCMHLIGMSAGDCDFSLCLSKLAQRGYRVIAVAAQPHLLRFMPHVCDQYVPSSTSPAILSQLPECTIGASFLLAVCRRIS